jgi:predicted metal-binding membrane protein
MQRSPIADVGSDLDVTPVATRDRGDASFVATVILLFAASVAATIASCLEMSGGMPMAGGWTMSMAWMRMPGQSWPAAVSCFLMMWVSMMVAMMLPSLTPMLSSYRRALHGTSALVGRPTIAVAAGYFFVWTLAGALVYPVGVGLAAAAMRWPAIARTVPLAAGVSLIAAGWFQLSSWKSRQLAHCRQPFGCAPAARRGDRRAEAPGHSRPDFRSAWRYGVRFGLHCSLCCSGLILILCVWGVMDLVAMAVVAIVITAERLAPKGAFIARTSGVAAIGAGVFYLARALTATA